MSTPWLWIGRLIYQLPTIPPAYKRKLERIWAADESKDILRFSQTFISLEFRCLKNDQIQSFKKKI